MRKAEEKKPAEAAVETAADLAKETVQPKQAAPAKAPAAKTVRKAAPKTAAKAAPGQVEEILVQFGAKEWNTAKLAQQAKEAYVAEGHRASGIKKFCLYIKPEDGKAYYVINDKATGSVEL